MAASAKRAHVGTPERPTETILDAEAALGICHSRTKRVSPWVVLVDVRAHATAVMTASVC